MDEYFIKLQICNLVDALHRNINENFVNISFEIIPNGEIQVKFILTEKSEPEIEYIYEIMAEYTALQEEDIILMPIIELYTFSSPLKNVVYSVRF